MCQFQDVRFSIPIKLFLFYIMKTNNVIKYFLNKNIFLIGSFVLAAEKS